MVRTISDKELAESLDEVLDRVRDEGEPVVIERDGERLAMLTPAPAKSITLQEFLEKWETMPKPDKEFWDDLEEIQAHQPPAEFREWD
jgi:antitoxin (DNA-binding transcriptional repressor) of toxin-antitoxin stability system